MNTFKTMTLSLWCFAGLMLSSCKEDGFGANPYDPDTPVTVSQLPKVLSFSPAEGEAGAVVEIKGVNFDTATGVSFGGKAAASFEIIDKETISAVVGPYGGSGPVAVTNHKGTRGSGELGFKFIKPLPPGGDVNYALEGTVTGSEAIAGAIANVIDGDPGSFWQAKEKADLWVQLDLGKIQSFTTVVLTWDPNAAGTDFELQTSVDGTEFTTIQTIKGWNSVADGGILKIYFEEVDARYIKLANMSNTVTTWNATLKEFEVYNKTYVDLAVGKNATASSEFYPVSNLVLGKRDFFWAANAVGEQWVLIDLGEELAFNNVDIYWGVGNFAKTTKIEISPDNSTFTELVTAPDWAPAPGSAGYALQRINFEETKARYVKFSFVEGTGYSLWCNEIEIYKR